jgi:hypothetical protein
MTSALRGSRDSKDSFDDKRLQLDVAECEENCGKVGKRSERRCKVGDTPKMSDSANKNDQCHFEELNRCPIESVHPRTSASRCDSDIVVHDIFGVIENLKLIGKADARIDRNISPIEGDTTEINK